MSDKFPGNFVTTGAPAGFSAFFDGNGDYLTYAANAGVAFGTGDFTIELFIYPTASFSQVYLMDARNSGQTSSWAIGFNLNNTGAGQFTFFNGVASAAYNESSQSCVLNQWNHCVAVRSGTTFSLFTNGTRVYTTTNSTNFSSSQTTSYISRGYSAGSELYYTGYMSNIRIVKGTAVYDPAQTTLRVPTQLLNITNTSLLTCQSPTFIDNSSNALTITPFGDAKVSNFTPFAGYTGFNPALGAAAGGVWTLDEAAYYQGTRKWPIYDPYFNQTTLMLHGNGTNGTQNNTFLDSSTNNFTITRNGNATQGTFTPFSQTGWSLYLPGSGTNYVQTPSSTTTALLGGALTSLASLSFTIECFINLPVATGTFVIGACDPGGGTADMIAGINADGTQSFGATFGGYTTRNGTGAISFNTWNHVAWVITGGYVYFYINGVPAGSATVGNTSASYGQLIWGGYNNNFSTKQNISNFRITKSAVYTSAFTPPTSPLTAATNTTLLTFQSNNYRDFSVNNYALTVVGSPTVQAFSPFVPTVTTPTTYSNWFDDSTGYFSLASNAALAMSTGNFTIEAWIYPTASGNICATRPISANTVTAFSFSVEGSGPFNLRWYTTLASTFTSSTSVPINTWSHVAIVRSSTTLTIYLNGVSIGTVTGGAGAYDYSDTSNGFKVGAGTDAGEKFGGFISNFRVVKGTAVYTTNFTPPTAPLTAIANTSLLTCQSSTLIDNSTNNFAITSFGTVQPTLASTPFPAKVDQTTLNTAYSTSLIGGSAYFDGTGDYLSSPNSTALDLSGSISWCIECWVYWNSLSGEQNLVEKFTNPSGPGWTLYKFSAGSIDFYGGSSFNSAFSPTAGQWYHVVICRDNTAARTSFFINGVRTATTTSFTIGGNAATPMLVGVRSGGTTYFNGYMAGLRVVKGQSVYDTTATGFVPPNAPFTTTGYGSTSQGITASNVSALFNYTNAGIIDNTAKNVLETVSSAAISTTQAKWGSSSMNFPVTTSAYLRGAISPNTKFPGAFTIEAWIYPTQVSARADIFATPTAASSGTGIYWYVNSSAFLTLDKGGGNLATSSIAISANRWTHVAATRNSSGAITLWTNGVASGTGSDTTNFSDGNLFVGTEYALANFWNGFIADLRVTNGVARYTTNFTPPTSQLQDQ